MRQSFFVFFVILGIVNVNAQSKSLPIPPGPPTDQLLDSDRVNHECEYLNKYSVEQRNLFYPFNVSNRIKLVSFAEKADKNGFAYSNGRLPLKRKKLIYSDLLEIKTLDESQVDSLTDILYNNVYRGDIFTLTQTGRYNPKNAIIFTNENGAMIAFIEICFECQGYRTSSKKVITGDFCNQKYELLKAFFQKTGIEFGITKGPEIDD